LIGGKDFFNHPGVKTTPRSGRRQFCRAASAGLSPLTVNVRPKSFIIQGFDDFCGVLDADLRLPLR
jgi:hypothetical protein